MLEGGGKSLSVRLLYCYIQHRGGFGGSEERGKIPIFKRPVSQSVSFLLSCASKSPGEKIPALLLLLFPFPNMHASVKSSGSIIAYFSLSLPSSSSYILLELFLLLFLPILRSRDSPSSLASSSFRFRRLLLSPPASIIISQYSSLLAFPSFKYTQRCSLGNEEEEVSFPWLHFWRKSISFCPCPYCMIIVQQFTDVKLTPSFQHSPKALFESSLTFSWPVFSLLLWFLFSICVFVCEFLCSCGIIW